MPSIRSRARGTPPAAAAEQPSPEAHVLDEERYARMTSTVLAIMAAVAAAFAVLGAAGYFLFDIPLDTFVILVVASALFAGAWYLSTRGAWRRMRHLPVIVMYLIAAYGNIIGGMGAPAILIYVLAILLSATLEGKKSQVAVVALSIRSNLAVASLHQRGILVAARNDDNAFNNRVLIASSTFIAIAVTLRFLVYNLEDAVRLSIQRRDELAEANRDMEARVEARTEELRRANAELAAALADLGETQNRLIHSERLATFGRVAARMAHELNTPLGAVLSAENSMVRVLDESLPAMPGFFAGLNSEERRWFLELVGSSIGRADQLQVDGDRSERRRLEERLRAAGAGVDDGLVDGLWELGVPASLRCLDGLTRSVNGARIVGFANALFTARRLCAVIRSGAEEAAGVVDALRGLLDQGSDSATGGVDLAVGLAEALAPYSGRRARGVKLRTSIGEVGLVEGNRELLDRVWRNLLDNAAQALGGKGSIEVAAAPAGDRILVSVTDDGPGIPDEILANLFEPFVTSKQRGEGLGLGLYVTKSIVERLGGRIECESERGRTVFRVYLRPALGGP